MLANDHEPLSSRPPSAAPHYHGHRERLRERFLAGGPDALADYELMELVLFRALSRRDLKPLAKALLKAFGSFAEVIAAPAARLAEVPGVGDAVIAELKIVQAAARRFVRGELKDRRVLSSWSAVLDYCRAAQAGLRRQGAVPRPVPRQAQSADRRRDASCRHRRPHAGLSARGCQARARAFGHRRHPRAQPPFRRSDAVPRRHPDDGGDRRGRASVRHLGARPHHRRQGRPRQPQGAQADVKLAVEIELMQPGPGM